MPIKKYVYISLASLSVAMGTLGMFLPVLPTTPFLLLAIWLFMRSSRKGVKIIMGNRLMAPYVHSYFSRNGIPKDKLLRILLTLWLTLIAGMIICRNKWQVIAILATVGIGVTIHLYCKRERNN